MGEGETSTVIAADFLSDPRLVRLFAAIEQEGDEARAVGGAVRDALVGRPGGDVDVATTALPETVMARTAAVGMKPVPTGIDHGTVTVVVEGRPFEVTTLRRDVATDGRHAVVAFCRDWREDALRRDFTINALSVGLDGVVHDFTGGIDDCRAGRVRFIGDARRRIAEDHLRILRFFRFHAGYGRGDLDPEGLAASIAMRDGLAALSAERVGQETLKLVVAAGAPGTVAAMNDVGLAEAVVGRTVFPEGLARLHGLVGLAGGPERDAASAPLLLAGLAAVVEADAAALADRLRLSNAVRDRMITAIVAGRAVEPGAGTAGVDRLLFRHGRQAATDGIALAHARARIGRTEAAALLEAAARRDPPVFPIGGGDLLALGARPGPGLGRTLAGLRDLWEAEGFAADRDALLARARTLFDG